MRRYVDQVHQGESEAGPLQGGCLVKLHNQENRLSFTMKGKTEEWFQGP